MKLLAVTMMFLSIITFQSCNEAQSHSEIEMQIKPSYVEGTLYLTPTLSYNGEGTVTLFFENAVVWVDKVEDESGKVIYDYAEPENPRQLESTLSHEDIMTGETTEIDVEPGYYTIFMTAEYRMVEGYLQQDNPQEKEYSHQLKQKIQVKK